MTITYGSCAAVYGTIASVRQGREFSDSAVYKLMEAMAWEIGRTGEQDIDRRFRELTAAIVPAQEADRYLNTRFGQTGRSRATYASRSAS